ncbi:transposase [Streptomyces sp. NBC_00057]
MAARALRPGAERAEHLPGLGGRIARRWREPTRSVAIDIGCPPQHDLRRITDAILYVDRTGIPWRYLTHDFAP